MISPSGGGLGCSAGCWSRHWPFPRAALKLPAPAAGGSQVSGAGAALGRRGRQAALARPCPNPSLPEGARPGSETWAEGFHGLLPGKCLQLSTHGCLLLLQLCGRDASDTQCPAALGYTPVWGGEWEAGCSGASLESSPARVGARLASEGWGAPVYSSSRQRCRTGIILSKV